MRLASSILLCCFFLLAIVINTVAKGIICSYMNQDSKLGKEEHRCFVGHHQSSSSFFFFIFFIFIISQFNNNNKNIKFLLIINILI